MSAMRWPIVTVLLIAVAAVAAPRIWSDADEPIGTASPIAAEHFRDGADALRRLELDNARTALSAAVEADPDFALPHLHLGHTMIWLGDREAGIAEIKLADSLAREPGLTTDLERLVIGLAASEIGDDEARREDLYERLVREYPRHPQSLQLQAQRAAHDGDPVLSARLYREVLDVDPSRVDIHNTLGYLALQEGQYEEAVACFKRYTYFAGDSANPHDSLGEAYFWTGRYHESIEQYAAALEADPSFLNSVSRATDALAVTGQFRLARKFLDSFEELFVQRNQESTRQVKALQVDYLAERWADVTARAMRLREDEENFTRTEPGMRLWINTLGSLALAELGRHDEAAPIVAEVEAELDRFITELDDESDSREELQLLRASLRCRLALLADRPAARELAELRGLIEASTRQPHRLLPYEGVLVQSLYEAGLDTEALEFAPRILDFNPNHPRTLLVSAQAHARQRNRDEAVAYLQRYLFVMKDADDTHPRVNRARQLMDRLAPSS